MKKKIHTLREENRENSWLPQIAFVYLRVQLKINVMTNPTMFSHALLEQIVYDLQKSNSINDPCVVDDLITCIKTHAKVEFKQI